MAQVKPSSYPLFSLTGGGEVIFFFLMAGKESPVNPLLKSSILITFSCPSFSALSASAERCPWFLSRVSVRLHLSLCPSYFPPLKA